MGGFPDPALSGKGVGVSVRLNDGSVHQKHIVVRQSLADMTVETDAFAIGGGKIAVLLLLLQFLLARRDGKSVLVPRADVTGTLPLNKRISVLDPDTDLGKADNKHRRGLLRSVDFCSIIAYYNRFVNLI